MRIKVFQVVESFDGQATETWLRKALETAVRKGYDLDWTFFCIRPGVGRDDGKLRALGAKVLHSSAPLSSKTKIRFTMGLRRALKDSQCDVLHCHHDVLSGLYLLASLGLAIRKRIVHVHNTYVGLPTKSALKQALGGAVLRRACWRLADHIVGVSDDALGAFMGGQPAADGRDLVIPVGIDTAPFQRLSANDLSSTRERLGIGPGITACLFVGRLVPEKNPQLCLRILAEMRASGVEAVLLFAGAGSLDGALAQEARDMGLSGKVRFLGWADNVAEIMAAADVLLWPSDQSRKEGLGLVVVEAQAAGLPVLVSNSLPHEAVVVEELVHACNLDSGPAVWAEMALRATRLEKPSRSECLARVQRSRVALGASVAALFGLYGLEAPQAGASKSQSS